MKYFSPRLLLPISLFLLAVFGTSLLWWFSNNAFETYDPGRYQRVAENSELKMLFPQAMNQGSVASHLALPAGVTGKTRWEGNMLVISPSKPLTLEEKYTIRVDRAALKSDGTPLAKDAEFTFVVAGSPKVSSRLPEPNGEEVPVDSRITIVFDRPMVPLTAVSDESSVTAKAIESQLKITPETVGTWRWLGTTTVQFEPERTASGIRILNAATEYSVTIPAGLQSMNGDRTTEEFSWKFATTRPQVISTDPSEQGSFVGPDQKITISFDREIDLQSAKDGIELFEVSGTGSTGSGGHSLAPSEGGGIVLPIASVAYAISEVPDEKNPDPKAMKKVEDRTKIVVTPYAPFQLEKSYLLRAKAGIRGTEGVLGTKTDFVLGFRTPDREFSVKKAIFEENSHLQFFFSHPVGTGTGDDVWTEAFVTLSPTPSDWKEVTVNWEMNGSPHTVGNLYLYNLLPSTKYMLTLSGAIADEFGQTLGKPFTYSFTTEPLAPEISIYNDKGGEFGIFERGKAPIYYLNSVNVSKTTVKLVKLPIEEFLKIRKGKQDDWQFQPDLSKFSEQKVIEVVQKKGKNHYQITSIDIQKILGGTVDPGVYVLSAVSPEYLAYEKKTPQTVYQYFTVTNLGITLKYSATQALVWVTDLRTGEPVKGAKVAFHSLNAEMKEQGMTDAQGFFETPLDLTQFVISEQNNWNPEFWVTATTESDFAFTGNDWNGGAQPWNFGINSDFRSPASPEHRVDSYLYTDRPIYRSGDTVHFKGLFRLRDRAGRMTLPKKGTSVAITLNDAENNEVFKKEVQISDFGSVITDIPLDAKASLGQYNLSARLQPEDAYDWNWNNAQFVVLAYKKPEYKVSVTVPQEEYFGNSTIEADIDGAYYFGAPMSNAKVTWRAFSTDYFFNKYTDGWYSFALEDAWCFSGCNRSNENITEGKGTLDTTGKMHLSFPVNFDQKPISQVVSVEAEITDANNQVVSSQVSVPVHKSKVYVGVTNDDYVVKTGEQGKVRIITVDSAGKAVANQKAKVLLLSREWNSIKKKGVDGNYYFENEPKDTLLRSIDVTTNEEGKTTASLLVDKPGEHRVIVETTDSDGHTAKAGTSIYGESTTYVNWPHGNTDRLEIIADKPEYKIGETAKLLVKSPWQGKNIKALVTVEREGVMTKRVMTVASNAAGIEVPITEEMSPNAYVSVVILKPRIGETFDENNIDTGVPAFKVGYVKLIVETTRKAVTLKLTTDKEKYGPGEEVTAKINATDWQGKPVEGEFSLGVVDMSVLALTGFEMPDLVKRFYSERGLGVQTAQLLTYLLERHKPGSKGGGGADPESRKRGNFKDTAYWNPSVITDKNGVATVKFALPDNLTTWQLLSVGGTKNSLFGVVAHTVIETKKVIVRSVKPRFALVGDQMQFGAIVHNFLDHEAEFTVSLSGTGFSSASPITPQTIRIAAGGQSKIEFPITIDAVSQVSFHLIAKTTDAQDEVEEKMPVYQSGTEETIATSGVVDSEVSVIEHLLLPRLETPQRGTSTVLQNVANGMLSLTVSPSIAAYLPKGLEYLEKYPYGCTEQTISRTLPMLFIGNLAGVGVLPEISTKSFHDSVVSGIERLSSFQRSDGGWGFWSESERSDPYLTAYALYALREAKKAGYGVEDAILSRADKFLAETLRRTDLKSPLNLTTRAYILFVQSENENSDASLANALFEKRAELPMFGKAYLAMTLQKGGSAEQKRAKTVLDEIMRSIKIEPRGAHFEEKNGEQYWSVMHTDTRTTAIVLQAILRIDPKNAFTDRMVRYLLASRIDGHWDTTQSTAQVLLALGQYLVSTGELHADMTATVSMNGKEVLSEKFDTKSLMMKKEVRKAFSDLMETPQRGASTGNQDVPVEIKKTGSGRLYYDLLMSYFNTSDTIKAAEQGAGITRSIMSFSDGNAMNGNFKIGQTYRVKLAVTAPTDLANVAVESPLPAGLEAIDTSLKTNVSFAERKNDSWQWSPWNHTEYRDDQVVLFAESLPAGLYEYEYLVRATTPGKFHDRPAKVSQMYFPEVFGRTDEGWVEIKD